jgi:hypothetical protein
LESVGTEGDTPVGETQATSGRYPNYFQAKVDEMWEKWEIPAVVPFRRLDATKAALLAK